MKFKTLAVIIGIFFLALGGLILTPVPIPDDEEDCLTLEGTVTQIYEAGEKDVVFRLAGHGRTFYVNRGLERGLELKKLRSELTNRKIVIKYPKYWSPLDPGNSIRHISKIEYDGQTVFTELE